MFYVSKVEEDKFYVTDTRDNVAEGYRASALRQISKSVEILGVYDDFIITVLPPKEIINWFQYGHIEKALKSMPLYYTFNLYYRSEPRGELNMTYPYNLQICRENCYRYSFVDEHNRRSTKDFDSLCQGLVWYVNNNKLEKAFYKE